MRPKKVVVVLVRREMTLSLWRFVLETRGFRVMATVDPEEALRFMKGMDVQKPVVVLAELEAAGVSPDVGEPFVRAVKQFKEARCVVFSNLVKELDGATLADGFLSKHRANTEVIVEWIRVLARRKRGPKKALLPAVYQADEVAA